MSTFLEIHDITTTLKDKGAQYRSF